MAAVTVTRVAVCPCSGVALQVAAGGSAVDGPGPSRHPKSRPPRAVQGQSRRRSRGRMTAPTIHVAATHAKNIICSPGPGICKQAAMKIIGRDRMQSACCRLGEDSSADQFCGFIRKSLPLVNDRCAFGHYGQTASQRLNGGHRSREISSDCPRVFINAPMLTIFAFVMLASSVIADEYCFHIIRIAGSARASAGARAIIVLVVKAVSHSDRDCLPAPFRP
jgi:hypothetical protein